MSLLFADTLIISRWPMTAVFFLAMVIFLLRKSPVGLPDLWREMIVVITAYFCYFLGRSFVEGRELEATLRAIHLIDLEQQMRIFWETDIQRVVIDQPLLVNFANWTYVYGHWPVVILAAAWLFFMRREEYSIYRNAFLISGSIGLIIFTILPLAPPRLVPGYGFVDTANAYHLGPSTSMLVNEYAAMPSLHFGWNLLVGIAIIRHGQSWLARAFGVVMPAAMFYAIVATGNHYIIDGLAGAAVALIGLLFAHLWHPTLQRWGEELRLRVAQPQRV